MAFKGSLHCRYEDCDRGNQKVPITSLQSVTSEELKFQNRLFLERFAAMTQSISKEGLGKKDSKELIMRFFDPQNTEFENIEMVMQVSSNLATY